MNINNNSKINGNIQANKLASELQVKKESSNLSNDVNKPAIKNDSVSLSTLGAQLAKGINSNEKTHVDNDKVAKLKAEILSGEYKINAQSLSESIVNFEKNI